ncbi:chitinase [Streptomyces sp. DconLS]|nr:chitinase [Streptomyces sp. DconLS]
MRRLHACLSAAAAVVLAAAGTTALVAANASGATPQDALSNRWYAAAPYLMPLDNDPPNASAIMDATGLKAFQLAFVLAPTGAAARPLGAVRHPSPRTPR